MIPSICTRTGRPVALLAEGVDRNLCLPGVPSVCRRVALLAEGVDRNSDGLIGWAKLPSRPPRGGRG